METNAVNFNLSTSLTLKNVSQELLSNQKREGVQVIAHADVIYRFIYQYNCVAGLFHGRQQ